MSRKYDGESEEVEEEEEDEGDFVPGMDDDDDLDDDFEDENLDDEDDEDPFVPGRIYLRDGKIALEGESFRLMSVEPAPPSFRLSAPALEKAMVFSGTVKDASVKMEVTITQNDRGATIDSLEQNLLNYQAEMQEVIETSGLSDSKPSARAKAGDDNDDEDEEDDIKSAPAVSMADETKVAAVGDVYVFEACQVGSAVKGAMHHKIRGVFRPISASSKASRLFLMVCVQEDTQAAAAGAAAASPAKAANTASSRKRGRHDEEDEEDGDDGVGYQEIIDLHDDAGLSTEELRQRYYGGDTGEPAPKMSKAGAAKEDSDDDDAYGF